MTQALVITEDQRRIALSKPMTELSAFSEFQILATELIGSSFMPSHIDSIPTLASILLMGKELQLTPMSSLQCIINIQGKLTLTASAMAALLRKSGVRYTLDEDRIPVYGDVWIDQRDSSKGTTKGLVDYKSTITFYELWHGQILKNTISILWSEAVIIATDNGSRALPGTYIKYAKNMMTARLLTRGVRLFCPEAIMGGLYTPEEILMDSRIELTESQLKGMVGDEEIQEAEEVFENGEQSTDNNN